MEWEPAANEVVVSVAAPLAFTCAPWGENRAV
jgi:hypothetical protein